MAESLKNKLIVTESPHARSKDTTASVMRDVIIALIPTFGVGIGIFGARAFMVTAVSIIAAVLSEHFWCKIMKKPTTVGDLSAVVTGLLLGLNLPVTMPFWMAAIGSVFAIIIVKQFFGGLGHNFMNPALAARAFLLTSWATAMTTWTAAFDWVDLIKTADVVTSATPLAILKGSATGELPSYMEMFLGKVSGSVGEVSGLAIIIGGIYLIIRKVITPRIPVAYLGTFAVIIFIFGDKTSLFGGDVRAHLFSGGILLGAFFMATDYVTTPYTKWGQIIFGAGCGILTAVIRLYGGYPEGVTYSVLIMNALSPLLDKLTAPKKFGALKVPKSVKGGD